MSNNSVDAAYAVAYHLTNSLGMISGSDSVNTWVTAMNNFQTAGGVIVQSLSNSTSADDADFVAAMPVYFSQLNEAWITAVNIDKTGSSGSYTYTRQSGEVWSNCSILSWVQMDKILQFLVILANYELQ